MAITVLRQSEGLWLISFGSEADLSYRVENTWGPICAGTTYDTLAEAEADYERNSTGLAGGRAGPAGKERRKRLTLD